MAVIKCPHCGEIISSNLSYCTECGKELNLVSNSMNDERQPSADECNILDEQQTQVDGCDVQDESQETSDEGVESEGTFDKPFPVASTEVTGKENGSRKWYHLSARRIVVLLFLTPFVVALVTLVIMDIRKARDLEQRAYDRLENCTDLLFYEDFLVRFPESKYAAEVKDRYEVMKAEHEVFFREAANGTREQLMEFIELHPTSPYRQACEMRVDSLDWNEALEANSLDGFSKYLALHPEGLFSTEASDARNRQLRLVVTPEETSLLRGALDSFLSAMTSGDAERINQLTGQSFTFCGQSDATGENVVDYYRQNLHGEDVLGVHFSLGGVSINKRSVQGSDAMSYSLYSTASATINRSALDSLNVVEYRVTANFSPERRITSVSVSQVVPVETPAPDESTVAGQ